MKSSRALQASLYSIDLQTNINKAKPVNNPPQVITKPSLNFSGLSAKKLVHGIPLCYWPEVSIYFATIINVKIKLQAQCATTERCLLVIFCLFSRCNGCLSYSCLIGHFLSILYLNSEYIVSK